MGVANKTRKFATVKRVIGQRDARLKKNQITNPDEEAAANKKKSTTGDELVRDMCVSTHPSIHPSTPPPTSTSP